ncbi:hypothetical protein A0H81_03838 [Grifola frondosa]|uniref:Uncharacterized protein n=1 Tax=Grifola frondosa TaxID=5627 RepID=A0A1C7MI04_GRIFR|nr:hypothetical protein A0H81_03838 [Grifola frondosa]
MPSRKNKSHSGTQDAYRIPHATFESSVVAATSSSAGRGHADNRSASPRPRKKQFSSSRTPSSPIPRTRAKYGKSCHVDSSDDDAFVPDDRNPKFDDFYRSVMLELRNAKESRGWVIRETHSPGAQLKDAVRMINRECGNHINIPELVTMGVALHDDPEPVETAQEMEVFKKIACEDIEKYLKAWGIIMRRVPFMAALMPDLAISPYGVVLLGTFLDAHA